MSVQTDKYHVVVIPEQGDMFVISMPTIGELVTELKKFYGTRTCVVPFMGDLWHISKGPTARYLLMSDGGRIPLFPEEPSYEVDPSGSLYTRDDTQEKRR